MMRHNVAHPIPSVVLFLRVQQGANSKQGKIVSRVRLLNVYQQNVVKRFPMKSAQVLLVLRIVVKKLEWKAPPVKV